MLLQLSETYVSSIHRNREIDGMVLREVRHWVRHQKRIQAAAHDGISGADNLTAVEESQHRFTPLRMNTAFYAEQSKRGSGS
jgi:hypothetical protein